MAIWADVIKNVINGSKELCSLCFESLNENKVSLQDEVMINNKDDENRVKLFDVLSFILDAETYSNLTVNSVLCKTCARVAISSYKFKTISRDNCAIYNNLLESLNKCLSDIYDNIDANTLYITLDEKYYTTECYYDSEHVENSASALDRYLIIKNNQYDITQDRVVEEDVDNETGTRKRRPYHSFNIKTRDMLYDKNDRLNLKCKACLKIYPTLSNLRNHYIRVHAPKRYSCSICQRSFGSISLLEAHKSESHVTLICKECGKTFNNRHTLKMHEIGHYLKIVCKDCGRVYKSQTTYKKHLDLNICGQKTRASPANAKFTCDYCNKRYTQKVSLRVHIQYEHGNYKAHECKWCKKKFWAPSRLKAHIVKHTQEKQYQCTICSGKFVSKESLLYHTRIHTGEKPYKCDLCEQKFISASRKADHMKRHHTNAVYQCSLCKIKYTTKLCLEKHMKTHIKDENSTEEANDCELKFKLPIDDLYIGSEEDSYYVVNSI